MNDSQPDNWLNRTKRNIEAKDWVLLLVGAVLGFAGNAAFSGDLPSGTLMAVAGVLTGFSAVALDRFRHSADKAMSITHVENRKHMTALKQEIDEHHASLRRELDTHLDRVHSAAEFVPQRHRHNGGANGSKAAAGYDVAAAAVSRARSSILVIGDYSPPPDQGSGFDPSRLPPNRDGYLEAIERMLTERLESSEPGPPLTYRRYIQRPLNIYQQIRARESSTGPGAVLLPEDMGGDEQVFQHCGHVLQIRAAAAKEHSDKVRIDLRVIPFLPNSPSVLLVDEHDLQFTIPTRIDQPGDDYAALGLLGVLALQDMRGDKICKHFVSLFDSLKTFSVFVKSVEPLDTPVRHGQPV